MQSGASLAHVVADAGAHFSAKEKQPIDRLSDHVQPHLRYVAALALVLGSELHLDLATETYLDAFDYEVGNMF
jgi:hypothetical protein